MIQFYDAPTVATLRQALDDVFADRRFISQRSTSALEIAEHLLAHAAAGERDLDRLKDSAFARLIPQTPTRLFGEKLSVNAVVDQKCLVRVITDHGPAHGSMSPPSAIVLQKSFC